MEASEPPAALELAALLTALELAALELAAVDDALAGVPSSAAGGPAASAAGGSAASAAGGSMGAASSAAPASSAAAPTAYNTSSEGREKQQVKKEDSSEEKKKELSEESSPGADFTEHLKHDMRTDADKSAARDAITSSPPNPRAAARADGHRTYRVPQSAFHIGDSPPKYGYVRKFTLKQKVYSDYPFLTRISV